LRGGENKDDKTSARITAPERDQMTGHLTSRYRKFTKWRRTNTKGEANLLKIAGGKRS